MLPLPELYSHHLKKHLDNRQYLILSILVNLLQGLHQVRLEELANRFPHPIQLRSRIKKLQRFLSLPQFNLQTLWLPLIESWIEQEWEKGEVIYIVIDRTQWQENNLILVSVVYDHRAIPVYGDWLRKKGNSDLERQKSVLEPVLSRLNNYKVVVLGDREFCGVDLAKWLFQEQKVYFSLRLKKNEYVELAPQIWWQLKDLGLSPGMSVYYQGVKVTKTKGFGEVNFAAKWKRKYRGKSSQEPWLIMTNLESLSRAMSAYSQRMGIEEMFRDFKKGGYQLEGTQVTGQRLISLVLLICLAYCWSTFSGQSLKQKGIAKYFSRPTSAHRSHRQHSSFYIGLHGQNWLDSLTFFKDEMEQLMSFSPHKHSCYRKGLRAASLIQSAL
jgi:hypothetical protein